MTEPENLSTMSSEHLLNTHNKAREKVRGTQFRQPTPSDDDLAQYGALRSEIVRRLRLVEPPKFTRPYDTQCVYGEEAAPCFVEERR